jgi:glutamyl-tRNA synthetase
MAITHVVRGDDHISNTPKQILLYQAAGADLPEFAHVPLILGSDRKRLSKRHGATSVMEYARQGYLPEAMVNFLALLGWSAASQGLEDRELFSRDELVHAFTLEGISGGHAVFNPEKLDWFNQQHIMQLAPDDLARRVKPWFEAAGVWHDDLLANRHAWFFAVLELFKSRAKRLGDFVAQSHFLFVDLLQDDDYDGKAVEKYLSAEGIGDHLTALAAGLNALPNFDAVSTETALRNTAEARGVKAASFIHAVRVAVTGKAVSPGLFDVLVLLGRERVHKRLLAAAHIVSVSRFH